MSETVPFVLHTVVLESGATPLHGLVDLPDAPGERPAVVICHGFKGGGPSSTARRRRHPPRALADRPWRGG